MKTLCKSKPFIKWAGGKTKLLPELAKRLPTSFNAYFEPFLGGGALFFNLQPEQAFLSDQNYELILTYQTVRDSVQTLIKNLKQHKNESDYFYDVRGMDRHESFVRLNDINRASRFIYLNKTCFNGLYRVNSKGEFNTPFGKYTNPAICDVGTLTGCSNTLENTTLLSRHYLTIENDVIAGDFVYFDPPYQPTDAGNFTSYTCDGFEGHDQVSLRDLCVRLSKKGVKFMLSNSDCPFITDLYQGFNIERVQAGRSINSNGQGRGRVSELIIRNYGL